MNSSTSSLQLLEKERNFSTTPHSIKDLSAQQNVNPALDVSQFPDTIHLTRTITDAGTNADDEIHNAMRIRDRQENPQEIPFFVFNGSNPYYAAAALHQFDREHNPSLLPAYFVIGQPFETEKVPSSEIPSYLDGQAISKHSIPGFHPEIFDGAGRAKEGSGYTGSATDQHNIIALQEKQACLPDDSTPFSPLSLHEDRELQLRLWESGKVQRFTQLQIAPIHKKKEIFNPKALERKKNKINISPNALKHFSNAEKLFIHQVCLSGNQFTGNNYAKSKENLIQQMLEDEQSFDNCTVVVYDGANAKRPAVVLDANQPEDPCVHARIELHAANLKRAWADFPTPNGVIPQIRDLHLGILTDTDVTPLSVNWSNLHTVGMNVARLLKEAALTPDSKEFTDTFEQITTLTHRLDVYTIEKAMRDDKEVARILSSPLEKMTPESLAGFYAAKKEIPQLTPELWLAKSYFAQALAPFMQQQAYANLKPKDIFTYGGEYIRPAAFQANPFIKKISEYRAEALNDDLGEGKSYVESFMQILKDTGSMLEYAYDACATYAGIAAANDATLRSAFAVDGEKKFLNINEEAMNKAANSEAAKRLDATLRCHFEESGYRLKYPMQ